METTDILILGAGATGLMAAYQLARAGKKVIVLEARDRIGGRIHTLDDASFSQPTELGAEFIHGDLPVTLQLLKEAGIAVETANAEMWRYHQGKFDSSEQFIPNWDIFIARLNKLERDESIDDFMQREFTGDQFYELRNSVWQFVSGYDTADPKKAGAFALRNEWQHQENDAQHRLTNGYGSMVDFLSHQVINNGGRICLNKVAKIICWDKTLVAVTIADGTSYGAAKLIVALPLGVLQAEVTAPAAVSFHPGIPRHHTALRQMGFGAVIKVLLEFSDSFWLDNKHSNGTDLSALGYLFSEEQIPTWWTQYPRSSNLLTGWIGGPAAFSKAQTTDEELLRQSVQSVANIFGFTAAELRQKLVASKVINWTAEPFSMGSYAYDTVDAAAARKLLNEPVEHVIYFAGEYLYEGKAMGTVEAALSSGRDAAKALLGKD